MIASRFASALLAVVTCAGQGPSAPPAPQSAQPNAGRDQRLDSMDRQVDNLFWYLRMADIAEVDDVQYTSLPPAKEPNPTAQGSGNPLIIHALTLIPKKLDRSKKQPLIVFAHGGVHSNTSSNYVHVFRELIERGYSIIAPDYRGSTGYGSTFYNQIDYGGREVDDVDAGREWMLERYSFLDPARVGMIGWSHGGLITLLNIFQRPQTYTVAYAGVPVSDLVARMGYKSDSYRAIFSARTHIGKTADDDVKEYLRRSPVTHVDKLATPLLVHTNTNDEDVNVLEVQRLIAALKAAGKKFEYKIYDNAPGGHTFNRIDTKLARESREEVWKFLDRYLKR
ncbi:MAG: alpha/beta fold hydrolase [Bryobacteraceae bacterium]|nr:alpha/beta fold hydrolase [Bryobacteraceae bacterium]